MDSEAVDSLVWEAALQVDLVAVLVVVEQRLEVVLVLSFERIRDLRDMASWCLLLFSLLQISSTLAFHLQTGRPIVVLLQISPGYLLLHRPPYHCYSSLVQELEAQGLMVVLEPSPFLGQVEHHRSGGHLVHLRLFQLEAPICR